MDLWADLQQASVFSQLPLACVLLSPTLEILDVTEAYSRLTLRPREALLGRSLFDVFPPLPSSLPDESANPLGDYLARIVASGEQETISVLRYDVLDPRSGSVLPRWWSVSAGAIRDDRGDVTHVVQWVEDVSSLVAGRAEAPGPGEPAVELQQALHTNAVLSQRLASLAAVAADLTRAESVADLEAVVVHQGLTVLGADGGAIISPHEEGGWRATLASLGEQVEVGYGHVPYDSPLPAPAVARSGLPLLLPTRAAGLAYDASMQAVYDDTGRAGWAFLPLTVEGRCIGSLAVAWREEHPLAPDELTLLEGFAAQCAQGLERIRATAEQRRSAQVATRMSETLQRSLLTQPAVPDELQVAVRYTPASRDFQVGGDWYDAFITAEGSALVVVGDVTGHDPSAAATMGQLRNLLRGLAYDTSHGPALLLDRLDSALHGLTLETLATAVLARVEPAQDARAQSFTWSNAGHLPPVVRRHDGRVEVLDTEADLLLGLTDQALRSEHSVLLEPGDTVVLYSDGLVERRTASLDDGIGALASLLARHGAEELETLSETILAAVGQDANEDDIALLLLRVAGVRSPVGSAAPVPVLELALPGQTSSVRHARRALRDAVLELRASADTAHDAVLLASELLTNAILHARSDVRLTAAVQDDQLEVEVFDEDSRVPQRQVRDPGALGGRGLALLDAMADGWGTRSQPVGKSVWFHLRLGR